MNIRILINGRYADEMWDAHELEGGLASFLAPAQAKDPISNESEGLDGKQIVDQKIKYQSRNITLPIYFKGERAAINYDSLVRLLKLGVATLAVGPTGENSEVCYVTYVSSNVTNIIQGGMVVQFTFNEFDPSNRYSIFIPDSDGEMTAGKNILKSEVTFQGGESGIQKPIDKWLSDIPSIENGMFLWSRTIVTYTDRTTTTIYCVAYQGKDGEKGDSAPHVKFQYSDDGNSGWSDITTENNAFFRTSTDDGETWSPAIRYISDVDQVKLDLKENKSNKGIAGGYASLDDGGKIPTSQLHDFILGQMLYGGVFNPNTFTAELTQNAMSRLEIQQTSTVLPDDPDTVFEGIYFIAGNSGSGSSAYDFEVGDWLVAAGGQWRKIDNTDAVTSVNGKIGNVTVTKTDVGLGNVANERQYSEQNPQPFVENAKYAVGAIHAENADYLDHQTTSQIISSARSGLVENTDPRLTDARPATHVQHRPMTGDVHTWLDGAENGFYISNSERYVENSPSGNDSMYWEYIGIKNYEGYFINIIAIPSYKTNNPALRGIQVKNFFGEPGIGWSEWEHIGDGANADQLNGKTAQQIIDEAGGGEGFEELIGTFDPVIIWNSSIDSLDTPDNATSWIQGLAENPTFRLHKIGNQVRLWSELRFTNTVSAMGFLHSQIYKDSLFSWAFYNFPFSNTPIFLKQGKEIVAGTKVIFETIFTTE